MEIEKEVRNFLKKIGKLGGDNRAKVLSPERRREIAKMGAMARTENKKKSIDILPAKLYIKSKKVEVTNENPS